MSRFFATGDTESETSSESENEEQIFGTARTAPSKFVSLDDSDSDDVKRVVKSAKAKRYEGMITCSKRMKNHMKINDWNEIQNDFDQLNKCLVKSKQAFDAEATPRVYIKCLVDLEDFIKESLEAKDAKKKMSTTNAKSLMAMKQKIRKNNKQYEKEIAAYRENPEGSEEEEVKDSEDSDSDSDASQDEDSPVAQRKSQPSQMAGDDESGSEDSVDWGSSDSESSSEEETGAIRGPAYFLKKNVGDEPVKSKKKEVKRKTKVKKDSESADEVIAEPKTDIEKPLFPENVEVTHDLVSKKLLEIVSQRGKKSTDKEEQLSVLRRLRIIADESKLGLAMSTKILLHIISASFDSVASIAQHMSSEKWHGCLTDMNELLETFEKHPALSLCESVSEEEENVSDSSRKYVIQGSMIVLVERLDDEFTKHLQSIDPHTTEYVERLKDDFLLLKLIIRAQDYCERSGNIGDICRIYLRHVEHLYYKADFKELSDPEIVPVVGVQKRAHATIDIIDKLCKFLYSNDTTDRIRTRAMLCHIYHHALHNRWYEARDLILMSHLQESIQHSDVPTQILFNRTMVQVGLCAFRNGLMKDAHGALHDICAGARVKELLAQGVVNQRHGEKNPEQEKIEKRRQIPFHMHINLELLECVYLTTSMLLEIPNIAANIHDHKRRVISKPFRRLLEYSERQVFTGPPENTRDHVIAGSKALARGDWRVTRDLILGLKIWNLFSNSEGVLKIIASKIQEEGLRTYLFTYSGVYDSLSMVTLSEMFELPEKMVHSIVSKMMINEELSASWDQPTKTVILHRTDATRLQHLTMQFSEKANNLVEQNERLFELRNSTTGYLRDQKNQKGARNSMYPAQQPSHNNHGNYVNRGGQKHFHNNSSRNNNNNHHHHNHNNNNNSMRFPRNHMRGNNLYYSGRRRSSNSYGGGAAAGGYSNY
eukprot:Sdes_comp9074_c0_seq1m524